MSDKYNHHFELPDSILSQMEEMSGGGYIIFILDSENISLKNIENFK